MVSTNGVSTIWPAFNQSDGCYIGLVIQKAISNGEKPLDRMIDRGYRTFTQIDVCQPEPEFGYCMYPQFEALDQLTVAYQDAYYIHSLRDPLEHAISLSRKSLREYTLLDRFKEMNYLNRFPGQSDTLSDLENMKIAIENMSKTVMAYFQARPDLKYLSYRLEEDDNVISEKVRRFLDLPEFRMVHANTGKYHQLERESNSSSLMSE
jgi:hypothetical protein